MANPLRHTDLVTLQLKPQRNCELIQFMFSDITKVDVLVVDTVSTTVVPRSRNPHGQLIYIKRGGGSILNVGTNPMTTIINDAKNVPVHISYSVERTDEARIHVEDNTGTLVESPTKPVVRQPLRPADPLQQQRMQKKIMEHTGFRPENADFMFENGKGVGVELMGSSNPDGLLVEVHHAVGLTNVGDAPVTFLANLAQDGVVFYKLADGYNGSQRLIVNAVRGEQQALFSLLQEIEQCSADSSTKLSLKVFQLQQLAAIRGTSHLLLQQHSGFLQLIKDLTAAAAATTPAASEAANGELSPQQLHALRGGLSVSEACSSLRCFAAAAAAVDRMHLAALMQHVLRDAGQVNEFDAACVLYAIRKLHLDPRVDAEEHLEIIGKPPPNSPPASGSASQTGDATPRHKGKAHRSRGGSSGSTESSSSSVLNRLSLKLVKVCAWAVEQRAATASPKSLVCCLYEFGLLKLLPWRLLLVLQKRLRQKQQLRQLDGQGLSLLTLSLFHLQMCDSKLLARIGTVVQEHLGPPPPALLSRKKLQKLQSLPNASLCLLLHAIAKQEFREKGLILAERRGELPPCEISLAALGAAKAAAAGPETLAALLSQALHLRRGFTGQQLVNLLDGVALSGHVKENAETCLKLLEVYVQLGEVPSIACRASQLGRIAFTLLLEIPEVLSASPRSLQLFIEDNQRHFQEVEPQAWVMLPLTHMGGVLLTWPFLECALFREIRETLAQLLPNQQLNSSTWPDTCVDLLSEGCYCPLSGALLGASLLKTRQLHQMGILYCSIRRRDWIGADVAHRQQLLLRALQQTLEVSGWTYNESHASEGH
ncbi:uncharacterized protein LOC34620431 [Cyclospora cayetanensis]|uniref:Uncharacterized protein LOC34620431 n=1 Tax=Cyclospora cayetanensis TaxID=88456 RepID=A0A6P6S2W8_9EIME|nr:uncharacterized protein LOC34620431 [Cyclospora cayetanensis]